MKKIIFILAFLLGCFLTVSAETDAEKIVRIYNTANELDKAGRYSEAIRYYIQAYELGEKNFAPMKLAEFYALGKGTQENFVESDKWLRIAADNGNAHAQNMVGDIYYYGMGVNKNPQEAAKWYLKSAEQGYSDAQYKIALAYLDGEGVPQNNTQGLLWLRKSADNNHPDAQDALAIIYGFGKNGVQKDEKEFVKWALKAANNGSASSQSQFRAGNIYQYGIGGIKPNKNEAIKWYKLAAEQGDKDAIQKLVELGY